MTLEVTKLDYRDEAFDYAVSVRDPASGYEARMTRTGAAKFAADLVQWAIGEIDLGRRAVAELDVTLSVPVSERRAADDTRPTCTWVRVGVSDALELAARLRIATGLEWVGSGEW